MATIVVKVKNKAKSNEVLKKLGEIKSIEVEENPNIILPTAKPKKGFWSSGKLFKDNIDAKQLRKDIWERKK